MLRDEFDGDLRRRARRSARARQPARARHPARHALRARPLRQLPAGPAARRSAVPAEGSRRARTSTSSCFARTPKASTWHRRPLQGRDRRRNRDSGRDQHLQGRATASSATPSSTRSANGLTKVCMADKSNAMQQGHALWQRVFKTVAAEYPDITRDAHVHRCAGDVPGEGSRPVRGDRHQQPVRRHHHRHRRRAAGRARHGGVGQHPSRDARRCSSRCTARRRRWPARTSPIRWARSCRRR